MEGNLLSIDAQTAIFTLINFLIIFFLLKKFLFGKVAAVLKARQEEVEAELNKTKADMAEAEKSKIESMALLKESKQKGKEIVEEYKERANLLSKHIIKDANAEASAILDRASKDIERETKKAQDELKKSTVDIAVMMTTKALEEGLKEDEQRKLIDNFIDKVGNA